MTHVYMAVGIPAIGKSTYLRDELDLDLIISSDQIRECINGKMEPNPLTEGLVWSTFRSELIRSLDFSGHHIGLDATFYLKRYRRPFIEAIRDYGGTRLTFIQFANNLELALSQQTKRERQVPLEAIQAMHKKFQPVTEDELNVVKDTKIIYVN